MASTKMIDISILGDKALTRSFNKLAYKTQRKFTRKALRAGAKVVQQEYKARVPVDSGALKRGIKVRAGQRSRKYLRINIITPERDKLGISADDKWYYPAVIEYGGVKKDGTVIPAQAPGRKALEAKEDEAIRTIGRTLWQQIKAEAVKTG